MAFPLTPTSGRSGYLKEKTTGVQEIPIFRWDFNAGVYRSDYRTSASENFPVRNGGVVVEDVTFTSPFFREFINQDGLSPLFIGDIGWFDLVNFQRTLIEITAQATKQTFEFDYTAYAKYAFLTTVTMQDLTVGPKIIDRGPITDITSAHQIFCTKRRCNDLIYSSDDSVMLDYDSVEGSAPGKSPSIGSRIKHVTNATVTRENLQLSYVASEYPNVSRYGQGVSEEILEFIIQGDFDYWYQKLHYPQIDVGTHETADHYRIYYGLGTNEYMQVLSMRVIDMHSFIVDVLTGRIIQATVKLGAARG
jgi:hypothetical protein